MPNGEKHIGLVAISTAHIRIDQSLHDLWILRDSQGGFTALPFAKFGRRFEYLSQEPTVKGTILDFLNLASEKPELAKELVGLAKKYDFEFTLPDEVTDEALDGVAGGATSSSSFQEMTLAKQLDKTSAALFQCVIEGNTIGTAEIDFVQTTEEEDD